MYDGACFRNSSCSTVALRLKTDCTAMGYKRRSSVRLDRLDAEARRQVHRFDLVGIERLVAVNEVTGKERVTARLQQIAARDVALHRFDHQRLIAALRAIARLGPVEHGRDQFGMSRIADQRGIGGRFKEHRADQIAVALPELNILLPVRFVEQHFIGDAALLPDVEAREAVRVPVGLRGIRAAEQVAHLAQVGAGLIRSLV